MTKGKRPRAKKDVRPQVKSGSPKAESPLSVSLKYWHSKSQCISFWQKSELEKLTKCVDKIQSLTASTLKNDPGLYWKLHHGPAASGFSRPAALSRDITLCEVRVASKARLHAAIFDSTFFLVWLDRNHEVFPEK